MFSKLIDESGFDDDFYTFLNYIRSSEIRLKILLILLEFDKKLKDVKKEIDKKTENIQCFKRA